ncbi:flavin-containing monooxygenase [Antrihabitans cavernicola]|uniref:NAD(P)/FAD-dependent oxidoreductase n=1 Tax=Antrihabitans cavernicola TaxID=2495913 RepID=A0A5A7S5S7_9NOCA|nr:NAD(P)/FAD-dependent oxidoreductase [Spelaeibacter cavernicola]KAA0021226.1 NAD(P)/FAD-dependent oxidoreductase [Spelaeibacter cavernicola]
MTPRTQDRIADSGERVYHTVVIGAGLAGLAAAYKLDRAGFTDFVVLEKADRVGGTWRDNTYPGCGVDIPSPVYSFSFNPNPDWAHNFASQPEILAYIEQTVAEFGLDRYVSFGTEAIEATWSDERRRWLLNTTQGRYVAQFLIGAAGPITEPRLPEVEGLDRFTGEVFHSARWNHDYDLTGKRVAVIGTGASAVQFIPEIAPHVAQLHVLQRTASWVVPRLDIPFPTPARALFRWMPGTQRAVRFGLDSILRSLSAAMQHERAARLLNPIGLAHLYAQVRDPELRAALTPLFTMGCKRLLLSNTYLPALARDNVELIPHALTRITERGVVAADGSERVVDAIIFGTGFDVSHPPIAGRVRGADGRLLSERWAKSPEAYLATTAPGVPNLFILLGPNILVYNSFLDLAERQLDYIVDALTTALERGIETIEIPEAVTRAFNDKVQHALSRTVFNNGGCASYYLDENGRNFAAWPWSTTRLRKTLSRFDIENYTQTQSAAEPAGHAHDLATR